MPRRNVGKVYEIRPARRRLGESVVFDAGLFFPVGRVSLRLPPHGGRIAYAHAAAIWIVENWSAWSDTNQLGRWGAHDVAAFFNGGYAVLRQRFAQLGSEVAYLA
jgi:hypothetical protein